MGIWSDLLGDLQCHGGKVPYSELTVRDIPKQLTDGYRLEKPSNDACSEEM